MKRAAPLADAAIAAALFLLNAWLNAPLFQPGEMPYRGSIEGGYAAMARFIAAHPAPWGWNPFQYCGLPTQFLYLPGLPYLAALGMRLFPSAAPDHIYRIATAVFACLGPVSLYFFVRYFTRSRLWGLAAALAWTFFSPAYGLIRQIGKDRGLVQLPWRVQVLAKYGEGPHNAGLALLPLALMAVWSAATGRRYRQILLAAVLLAAVCLTNWVAALALAICCVLLLLAGIGTDGFRPARALAAAGLAYLLACFWLTPTFVRTIAFNWPADSFGYTFQGRQELLLAGLAGGVLLLWGLFRWRRADPYLCFVTLAFFTFAWITVNFYSNGADTLPESRRYALEFELFLLLAVIEWIRLALRNPSGTVRFCAIAPAAIMLLAGAGQGWRYATQSREKWRPAPREQTAEFQVAGWIARQKPAGRVLASGGLRFRLNSWFDVSQVGGGFESGLQTRVPVDLAYRVRTGKSSRPLVELRALGVQYVVVHGSNSREYYRDFLNAAAIAAALPEVYSREDDHVFAVPFTSLAHLVAPAELPGIESYARAIEDPARPKLDVRRAGTTALDIAGPLPEGMLVSLQENYDPGWEATQDGRAIPVTRDGLGYLLLHPRPAPAARLQLRYRGTTEQKLMAALSALAWLAALGAAAVRERCL